MREKTELWGVCSMTRRTAIPSKLKRHLLVECGHKCAVTGCGHPAVVFHHIICWAQCQEHDYRNLIALCPNHHAQVHRGEIDRKALRMYKSRAATNHGGLPPDTPSDARWIMESLVEIESAYPAFEVELEFPRFLEPDLADLTILLQARARRRLMEYRRQRLNVTLAPEDWELGSLGVYSLSESLQVLRLDGRVIGLGGSTIAYGAGAAHPTYLTRTLNFLRSPLTPLHLEDLLDVSVEGLRGLGNLCRMELHQHQDEMEEPLHFLSAFAGVDAFRAFLLAPEGLWITFDPGTIGAMSDPVRRIFLTAERLEAFVGLTGLGRDLWQVQGQ